MKTKILNILLEVDFDDRIFFRVVTRAGMDYRLCFNKRFIGFVTPLFIRGIEWREFRIVKIKL